MQEQLIVVRTLKQEAIPKALNYDGGGDDTAPVRPSQKIERLTADPRELEMIRRDPSVAAAAVALPLRLYEPLNRAAVTDFSSDPWGLIAVGATRSACTGLGATVAVLDTGIDTTHAAFAGLVNGDRLAVKDFTGDGEGDSNGHGTHCCGVAFGGSVNGSRIGVAPGVRRALVGKVIGTSGASTAGLAEAIEWALREGANVVSMSLGIDYPTYTATLIRSGMPPELAAGLVMERERDTLALFATVASRGRQYGQPVMYVAAAGNSSRYNVNPDFVLGAEPPAAADGFTSVSALEMRLTGGEPTFRVADFSNGRAVLCGPGVDIVSARAGTTDGLISMSGTSMATPHVAGVAALWYESLQKQAGVPKSDGFVSKVCGSGVFIGIDRGRIGDVGAGIPQAPRE